MAILDVYEYEETYVNEAGETCAYTCSFSVKEGVKSPIEGAELVDKITLVR